jgi:hypothetical protein
VELTTISVRASAAPSSEKGRTMPPNSCASAAALVSVRLAKAIEPSRGCAGLGGFLGDVAGADYEHATGAQVAEDAFGESDSDGGDTDLAFADGCL